ncbi:hypothetical protein GCM10025864_14360 [Luteimicrobium album]|uniref:FAD dependent oxidoreductase n=1 Tax=Luteimicrobium album TaxID=1054550 RepID=A0ABQ6HZR6_9MICO|nr:hypothetical protein GCM10025864_14360 [Luteimicrobium album]
MVPRRVRNFLAAGKNIGTTHITNGCYRLHPVEWNIGESAGIAAARALRTGVEPHSVLQDENELEDLQREVSGDGIELRWPAGTLW